MLLHYNLFMSPLEVIDIGRDGLMTLIQIAAPIMVVALLVGLIIALFQALTQIQEMTLTFVPKIIAIFFTMMLVLPYMYQKMYDFNERLIEKITDQNRIGDIEIKPDDEQPEGTAPIQPRQ